MIPVLVSQKRIEKAKVQKCWKLDEFEWEVVVGLGADGPGVLLRFENHIAIVNLNINRIVLILIVVFCLPMRAMVRMAAACELLVHDKVVEYIEVLVIIKLRHATVYVIALILTVQLVIRLNNFTLLLLKRLLFLLLQYMYAFHLLPPLLLLLGLHHFDFG